MPHQVPLLSGTELNASPGAAATRPARTKLSANAGNRCDIGARNPTWPGGPAIPPHGRSSPALRSNCQDAAPAMVRHWVLLGAITAFAIGLVAVFSPDEEPAAVPAKATATVTPAPTPTVVPDQRFRSRPDLT